MSPAGNDANSRLRQLLNELRDAGVPVVLGPYTGGDKRTHGGKLLIRFAERPHCPTFGPYNSGEAVAFLTGLQYGGQNAQAR